MLLFQGCGSTSPYEMEYSVCWLDGGSLRVDLDMVSPDADSLYLYYGEAFFGGQMDIFTCVKDLACEGAVAEPDSSCLRILLRDFSGKRSKITYRVEQTLPDAGINCPSEMFRPNITDDFLYCPTVELFLQTDPEVPSPSVRVKWGATRPPFPVFCLYSPADPFAEYTGLLSDMRSSVVVGDRGLVVDTLHVGGTVDYLVTAPRALCDYNREQIGSFFRKYYSSMCRFWGEDPPKTYSLIVYPFEKIQHFVSGIGLDGGFLARYSAQADTILTLDRESTFAHEIGHNWVHAPSESQWWGEGFNEIQTMYMLTASGLRDVDAFVDYFNDTLSKLHRSSIRNLPNDRIAENFWSLGDYSWIPYWRGAVYAMRLLGMLEEATGTPAAYKSFMTAMKPHLGAFTREAFVDVASEFLDRELVETDLQKYVYDACTMDISSGALPTGCEAALKEDGTPFLRITDRELFGLHFVL